MAIKSSIRWQFLWGIESAQPPVSVKRHTSTIHFYRHAHLYFAMAFVVTMAGFWPSFFTRARRHGCSSYDSWNECDVMDAWFQWYRHG